MLEKRRGRNMKVYIIHSLFLVRDVRNIKTLLRCMTSTKCHFFWTKRLCVLLLNKLQSQIVGYVLIVPRSLRLIKTTSIRIENPTLSPKRTLTDSWSPRYDLAIGTCICKRLLCSLDADNKKLLLQWPRTKRPWKPCLAKKMLGSQYFPIEI